ncbi:MAG: signal peptidase II [Clostridia bacterium]|nr:signal peptidase II [Clostridia bacterium]
MNIVLMFSVMLVSVAADQVTKLLAVNYLKPSGTFPIIEGALHLTYSENTGAAFGMLKDARWVFMVFSSVAIIAILAYFFIARPKDRIVIVSLGMILGGGIGNMIDRVFQGFVVDFIDFRIINFAIFNVADSCITVGAAILILSFLIKEIGPALRKKGKETGHGSDGEVSADVSVKDSIAAGEVQAGDTGEENDNDSGRQ